MGEKGIALACRMDSERAIKLTKEIFEFLTEKNEEVFLETRIAPKIFAPNSMNLLEMSDTNLKALLSVGGDGTLLRVASNVSQLDPPPILGVNVGSVGFLDETNHRKIFRDLEKITEGEYIIEECSKITPYVVRKNSEEIRLNNGLNEVLVVSSKSSKVLQVSIAVNGVFLNRSYLDGVIVSTSTGSTAYNLSAGGAILFPSLDVMQITPLNAFARSGIKPIIVPDDAEVEIRLLRPRLNAKIIIDGQKIVRNIQPNTKIRIRKAEAKAKFIRLSDDLYSNYFRRLRKKILPKMKIPPSDSPEE
ncbi:MAG: NAD kinase [Promethearchaeota archaeon]|nr:MAG: NAD kinase [Candidatus Lokiarchaeota archaeon]